MYAQSPMYKDQKKIFLNILINDNSCSANDIYLYSAATLVPT